MTEAPPQPPSLSDWDAMQQHYQAQPQLLARLLGMLGSTLDAIRLELEQAMAAGDMDALAKVAHNIKGTALNLHTPELARLAIQAQEEARRSPEQALLTGRVLVDRLTAFVEQATRGRAP